MADRVHLYAWAAPAMGINVLPDHTWITTHDNRKVAYKDLAAVVSAGEHFWYCWGLYRSKGGTPGNSTGALGDASGDAEEAACLAEPNLDCASANAARGTIFKYGRDGVCHQLANQVLYATRSGRRRYPLTVVNARGYMWSVFRFGTYGLQEEAWKTKQKTCGTGRKRSSKASGD